MTSIIRISRPRFWLYVFGPYLIGIAAGAASSQDFLRADAIVFGLFFLLPANLLIYGINDIFDYETDRLNPKKVGYEVLVQPESYRSIAIWILALNLPFIVAAYFLAGSAITSLAIFLVLSIFYSAPPIRAKAIPVVDSLFNVLYILPGSFAYQMLTGNFPPLLIVIAGGMWTAAMHAYSAIPDVEADRRAGLSTVATLFGRSGTLVFCFVMYVAATVLVYSFISPIAIELGFIYCGVIIISYFQKDSEGVFLLYRRFPLLNAGTGLALFWFVAISNLF